MLWFKAWLESRTRFLIGLGVITLVCAVVVVGHELLRSRLPSSGAVVTYADYIYLRVYGGFVRGLFLLLALVLGLGGLNGERATHTLPFTLALPVPKHAFALARAAVGLIEIVALAVVPALVVPALSSAVGQAYPWSQSASFLVLWVAIGWAVFAAAFLASCVFESDQAALTVSLIVFYVYPLLVARTPLLRSYPLHLHYIMNGRGMAYVDARTHLFVGPMPWLLLAGVSAVSLVLFLSAIRVSDRIQAQ